MTSVDDRLQLAPSIHALLGTLRRRIRRYVWAEGIANGLAWLGTAFWLSLATDWFFEPPLRGRLLMIAAAIGVLAVLFVRQIGRRAFVRLTNSNMATVLERRFPQLNDSLLTAVVLCGTEGRNVGFNEELLFRVCQTAAQNIKTVRWMRYSIPGLCAIVSSRPSC